jgi:hypothetical protein
MKKQNNLSTDSLKNFLPKFLNFFTKHRFSAVFIIASASVIAALIQSGTYLNPTRNDLKYEEEKVRINYSSIDEEIVEKLNETQNDANVEVNESLVPSRSNPFSE